jgi:Flp pilus assembly protein TadD
LALGSIAQRGNKLEEADKRYSTALELNPFNTPARANRGEVRLLLGRLVEGAQDLLRAMQEDPEERHASTKRARVTLALVQTQLEEAGVPGAAPKTAVAKAATKIAAAAPRAKPPGPRPRPKPPR